MVADVVEEVRARVETLVSSWFKQVEGEVQGLKRGLKVLSDGMKEKLGKLEEFALDSVLDLAGTRYASTLKAWTGKTTASVVYDSKVDQFTDDGLFQAVKGKPNVAIITTTTDGDVFGGFYSVAVTDQDRVFFDPNLFLFSFESHGRCMTPKKFDVKEKSKDDAGVMFYKNDSDGWFVTFDGGSGCFYLGNEKSRTFCVDLYWGFEGIEDTKLTGKKYPENFTCTRLLAIQLV